MCVCVFCSIGVEVCAPDKTKGGIDNVTHFLLLPRVRRTLLVAPWPPLLKSCFVCICAMQFLFVIYQLFYFATLLNLTILHLFKLIFFYWNNFYCHLAVFIFVCQFFDIGFGFNLVESFN